MKHFLKARVVDISGVMQITKGRCWTSSEIEYLKDNWHKKKTQEIAEELGRTYYSIYNKGIGNG